MPDLTPGDGQDVLSRFKQALERRDVDLMMELFREDAEFRPDPFEQPLIGDIAIRGWWNHRVAALAHVEFDAERTWVSGTTVLASWHAGFTERATAQRTRQRGFLTAELDDERLVSRLREWSVSRTVGTDSGFRAEPVAEATREGPDGR